MVFAEKMHGFMILADMKDWVMLVALISLTVQLGMKIFENVVLNMIMAGVVKIYKGFRKKDEDGVIRLQIIMADGSDVCHLHAECSSVKRMLTRNRKELTICTECKRYLAKETNRAFVARNEV